MTRFLNPKILMLTATLLVAAIAVGAAERPFSGTGSGIAVIGPEPDGKLAAVVTGTGNATHLGIFTNSGKVFFGDPDPSNPNLVHPTGYSTFTAANGDKVESILENGTVDLSTGVGEGDFRVTGGTGRFANATGITSYVVEQNLLTGAYEITLVGSINY